MFSYLMRRLADAVRRHNNADAGVDDLRLNIQTLKEEVDALKAHCERMQMEIAESERQAAFLIKRARGRWRETVLREREYLKTWARKIAVGYDMRERRITHQINRHHGNLTYLHLGYEPIENPPVNGWEFSVYSQNGEDGLLLWIFDVLGMGSRVVVEISPGDGTECNARNLIQNFGWSGLLVDGSEERIARARRLYHELLGQDVSRVHAVPAFVTAENINSIVRGAEIEGEIDLLSIDVDGMDFWLWRALEGISARVVVIECNPAFGARAVTLPYQANFVRRGGGLPATYYGASPEALRRLGVALGYALVAMDSTETNMFFVRRDLLSESISELRDLPDAGEGFWRNANDETKSAELLALPLVEVDEEGMPRSA